MTKIKLAFVAGAGLLLLSACDESEAAGGDGSPASAFGASFAAAFNADRNATPVDAQSVSLALQPRAEPIDF